MKIGVASEGTLVSAHFGHCEKFQVFEVQDGKIVKEEVLENAGKGHDFLSEFLNSQGIGVVITGGIGKKAIDRLKDFNIEIISGAVGEAKTAVESYLRGELKSKEAICNHHHGEEGSGGTCGSHGHHGNCQKNHIQDGKQCGH